MTGDDDAHDEARIIDIQACMTWYVYMYIYV